MISTSTGAGCVRVSRAIITREMPSRYSLDKAESDHAMVSRYPDWVSRQEFLLFGLPVSG